MTGFRRILLLGASGQIGWEVARSLSADWEVYAPGRNSADLSRPSTLREAIRSVRPAVIVNAAGYTAVDRAERESLEAAAANAIAPGVVAEEAERSGALLVHYSTNYVFDGAKREPYTEDDATGPLSTYGQTKLDGERAVAAVGGRYVVIRTSWVYSSRRTNFLLTMLRLFREQEEVQVVRDQNGTPTASSFVALATARVLEVMPDAALSGVYHLTAAGQTTWHGFASRILELASELPVRCRRVVPIRAAEYPTAARRPGYSVLDSRRFCATFGFAQIAWEELVRQTVAEVRSPSTR